MKNSVLIRRKFIKSLLSLPVLSLIPVTVNAATKTPRPAKGPFYPTDSMRFADVDNNLVKISGVVKEAGGEVITLRGRVLDTDEKTIET